MALSANVIVKRMGEDVHPRIIHRLIADNVHVYAGAIVVENSSGYAIPATSAAGATNQTKVLGVSEGDYDNTVVGHAAGALKVRIRQGTFMLANGSGVQALTVADEGRVCYAYDDATVQKGNTSGLLPVAGTVIQVESAGVWVTTVMFDQDPTVITLPAADNFAAAPSLAVKLYSDSGTAKAKTAGAGDQAIGVLLNTPVAAGIARVKTFGPVTAYASGTINVGEQVAADASGQLKKASLLAVTNANANGSYVLGVAITAGSANNTFQVFLQPVGAAPTNGV